MGKYRKSPTWVVSEINGDVTDLFYPNCEREKEAETTITNDKRRRMMVARVA